MRSWVFCVLLHLVHLYGLEETDCTVQQLLMKERYCSGSHTALTMHTLPQSLHKINLSEYMLTNTGCLVESEGEIGKNNTYYIECETEDKDCVDDDSGRNVFVVECEDMTLNRQVVEEAKAAEKNQIMLLLVESAAAACSTVGLGFLVYKLKTLFQSGSYSIPA